MSDKRSDWAPILNHHAVGRDIAEAAGVLTSLTDSKITNPDHIWFPGYGAADEVLHQWQVAALAQGVTKVASAQVSESGRLLTIDLEHDGRWYIRAQEMHHGGLRLLGSGDDTPAAWLAVADRLWGGDDE